MRKYLFLSIVSLLAVASCTVQEILIQEADSVEIQDVYHAGFGDVSTKTGVDAQGRFYWDQNDMVSVFRSTANQPYIYEGESGARLADFVRADDSFYAGQDIPATIAVYPYSDANAVTDDGSGVYVSFSSYQYYAEGSFGRGAAPLVAVTKDINDRDLNFKNLAGFLVIPAYGDVTVETVEFQLNSGLICSSYLVNPVYGEDPVMTEREDYNVSSFVLNCSNQTVALSKDKFTEFWLALPPMTMDDGFTVTFTTSDGKFQFSTWNSRTISRNVVNRMAPVSVSTEDAPWQYFENPCNGEPMVFTFTQNWWGEIAEGYIKYRTVGNVRVCQTETFPHSGGYGFWGLSASPEEAVEWTFLWHLNNNTIELPCQYTGWHNDTYDGDVLAMDDYHYVTDIQGKVLGDWDNYLGSYNHGYYDGNGGFYLYVYRYYMIGVGGWNPGGGYDTVLEAQSCYDRSEWWVNIGEDIQTGAEKVFHFNTGRTVSRVYYTFLEGKLAPARIPDVAWSIQGCDPYVDVYDQYASITLNPGITGKYTLVAITDGGEYSYLYFDYVNPDDVDMGVTIEATPGTRTIDYVVKGTGVTEAYAAVMLTEQVSEEIPTWLTYYYSLSDDDLSALNEGGYYATADGLTPGRSYTIMVVASNGILQQSFTAEFVTEAIDYEPMATGVYDCSAWWGDQERLTLYRDPSVENGYVITGWGESGVDVPFVWNKEDNTVTLSNFQIGYNYGNYGPMYYMESRDYFNSRYSLDESDSRLQSSYYESGVFYFHFVLYVAAGRFGDYWETFTLDEIPGTMPTLYASTRYIHANYDQWSALIYIESNTSWTASKANPEDTWFQIDNPSNYGDTYLYISLENNDSEELRAAEIVIAATSADGNVVRKTITLKQSGVASAPVRFYLTDEDIAYWTSDQVILPYYTDGVGTMFEGNSRIHRTMPFGTYTFRWSNFNEDARVRHWFCFGSDEIRFDMRCYSQQIYIYCYSGTGTKPSLNQNYFYDVDYSLPHEVTYKFEEGETAGYCHVALLFDGEELASFDSNSEVMRDVLYGSDINMYLGVYDYGQYDDINGSAVLEWYECSQAVDWGYEDPGIPDLDVNNDYQW